MTEMQSKVREFHEAMGTLPVPRTPVSLSQYNGELRCALIEEEAQEFRDAWRTRDRLETLWALRSETGVVGRSSTTSWRAGCSGRATATTTITTGRTAPSATCPQQSSQPCSTTRNSQEGWTGKETAIVNQATASGVTIRGRKSESIPAKDTLELSIT